MRKVHFPGLKGAPAGRGYTSQLDIDVDQLLRWLAEGPQDRVILAQRMGKADRMVRLAIEEARRRGHLVISERVNGNTRIRLYRIARTRAEYDEWERHEVMSRMGSFGQQLRAMRATRDRTWPYEQGRMDWAS